jgi:hypothetical protein
MQRPQPPPVVDRERRLADQVDQVLEQVGTFQAAVAGQEGGMEEPGLADQVEETLQGSLLLLHAVGVPACRRRAFQEQNANISM